MKLNKPKLVQIRIDQKLRDEIKIMSVRNKTTIVNMANHVISKGLQK